jgi:hypothetical protein
MLPVPIEYRAISHHIQPIADRIAEVDLSSHLFEVPKSVSVPKVTGGIRIARQLSPIDSIIYTAIAYEVSSLVEAQRIPEAHCQSCSYRVKPDHTGRFFAEDEGYNHFKAAIISALEDPGITHVVTLDLSDFYGQISHHRIQNNLEAAGVDSNLSKVVEHILGAFNSNQHSQGIPIGPAGSIILSEAALLDIDDFLARQRYRFCRYVDDFRLFFPSLLDAELALRKLIETLHRNHRLPINSSKTAIWSKEDFMGSQFVDEEELEQDKKAEKLNDLEDACFGNSMSSFEISPENENLAARQALQELFAKVEGDEPLPLGLAKFVIRRARAMRTDKIADRLLGNLKKFLPVLRDVVLYFDVVDRHGKKGLYGQLLAGLISNRELVSLPFVQEWCAYSLFKNDIYGQFEDYFQVVDTFDHQLKSRYLPLLAAKTREWTVIRELKEQVDGMDNASKRSIILSSCVLPKDEKHHWLGAYLGSSDIVISACAAYAKSNDTLQPTI